MKELLIHHPDHHFYHFLIKISSYVILDDRAFSSLDDGKMIIHSFILMPWINTSGKFLLVARLFWLQTRPWYWWLEVVGARWWCKWYECECECVHFSAFLCFSSFPPQIQFCGWPDWCHKSRSSHGSLQNSKVPKFPKYHLALIHGNEVLVGATMRHELLVFEGVQSDANIKDQHHYIYRQIP